MRHIALLALAGAFFAADASAATTGGSFQVTATVAPSCTVMASQGIAFGNYDPATTHFTNPLDANGSIDVRCTKGTAVDIALDEGLPANKATGSTCGAPIRQMASGTDRLAYAIYSDATHTTAWGCAAANDISYTSTSNATRTLTTYGRVPGGQDVNTGGYSDTVAFTITF